MSTGAQAARLGTLTRELRERWQQTRESWLDAKAQEFEDRYLRELERAVQTGIVGLEQLETLLRRIRSDCESHPGL